MKLLALHKPIKKPPRSDERDGELFCGTGNEETKSFTVPARSSGTATYNIAFSSEIVAIKSYSDPVARTYSISFSGNLLTFTAPAFDQYSYNVTATCFVK